MDWSSSSASVLASRSEEHTSELQSHLNLVCRLLLEKNKEKKLLWYCLRRHNLCCLKFRRQYPIGPYILYFYFFFFNDTATTEIYTLSLHDAPPFSPRFSP